MDYYMADNKNAINKEQVIQNYYEALLLGWLGIVLMEGKGVWNTAVKTE